MFEPKSKKSHNLSISPLRIFPSYALHHKSGNLSSLPHLKDLEISRDESKIQVEIINFTYENRTVKFDWLT